MASTIKDVARLSGLGLATISKYINGGRVKPQNQKLIEMAIRELNFVPNRYAQGLRSNRTHLVALIMPPHQDQFIMRFVNYFEQIFSDYGYSVLLFPHLNSSEEFQKILGQLKLIHPDGIIMDYFQPDEEDLRAVAEVDVPVVSFDILLDRNKYDHVLVDSASGIYFAVKAVIEKGYRRIGIITGPMDRYSSYDRYKGYCRALEDYYIELDRDLVYEGDYEKNSGYEGLLHLMKNSNRPEVVICCNYKMTLGAMKAMSECGIRINEDVLLISFDEVPGVDSLFPNFLHIRQPIREIAELASCILKKRMEGDYTHFPKMIRLEPVMFDTSFIPDRKN